MNGWMNAEPNYKLYLFTCWIYLIWVVTNYSHSIAMSYYIYSHLVCLYPMAISFVFLGFFLFSFLLIVICLCTLWIYIVQDFCFLIRLCVLLGSLYVIFTLQRIMIMTMMMILLMRAKWAQHVWLNVMNGFSIGKVRFCFNSTYISYKNSI